LIDTGKKVRVLHEVEESFRIFNKSVEVNLKEEAEWRREKGGQL